MNQLLEKAKKLGIKIPEVSWREIDEQIRPILKKMEDIGIKIDISVFEVLAKELSQKSDKLSREICELAGRDFNVSSPMQMAEVLFTDLGLPKTDIKKTKTGLSTSASELKKIEDKHPIIPKILEFREITKLVSTYLKPLPLLVDNDFRLHTHFGLETSTSRLTSSEPNLQNIPIKGKYGPDIRRAFIAEDGMKFVVADYSQIELRIAAVLAGDESMLNSFKKGEDIHSKVASEVFGLPAKEIDHDKRRIAKIINFGILYGVSPYGLAQQTGLPQDKCLELITKYFEAHKGIKNYINEMSRLAREDGFVETLFGFKRELPNIHSANRYLVEADERIAANTPIQGTAAEVLKLAMVELDKQLASLTSNIQRSISIKHPISNTQYPIPRIIMTVHDEIIVEAPEDMTKEVAELMEKVMVSVIKLPIPLEVNVGVGDNWDEAK